MFFYNWEYLLYMVPALIISVLAQLYVKSTFSKYSKQRTRNGLTGYDACSALIRRNNLPVTVQQVSGELTDHYDPRSQTISLSESVASVPSVAAVSVAAHELGHAIQHDVGYLPIKIRTALVPIVNIASGISPLLIMVGLIVSSLNFLLTFGIILFSFAALFQLVTLPVEINASRRALTQIDEQGLLSKEELKGARKVLTAAALTYVAGLLTSLMQLLYLFTRFGGNSRND